MVRQILRPGEALDLLIKPLTFWYETDARRRSGRLQTDPDGSRRSVWMIIGMIKAHPTQYRVRPPRRASLQGWMLALVSRRRDTMQAVTERRSYKNELPGSRSGPCLGCDGRVVTARDPHVSTTPAGNLGGQDGTDAGPERRPTTNPNRLLPRLPAAAVPAPEPHRLDRRLPRLDPCGLGATLRIACWDLHRRATQRLQHDLHSLPSGLPGLRPLHPRQGISGGQAANDRCSDTHLATG
jgi:hypothetical protein